MGIATSGGEEPRPWVEARPEGQGAAGAAARPADARAPQPALELEDASFSYAVPAGEPAGPEVVSHASARVPAGAFALLVGGTGSGKTTLLKLIKPEIRPQGALSGAVRVLGRDAAAMSPRESAESVGYVFQSPDSQIVCDSVWHELAFGLENLGVPQDQMRRRVAETCYFFGMEPWFHRRCADLSGGQRQLLALASALAMRPSVLLLDEPTSMLDPVAEKSFLSLLYRVNRELGCTVVVATHAPRDMVDFASMAFCMEGGRPRQVPLDSLREEPALIAADGPAGAASAAVPDPAKSATALASTSGPVVSARDAWVRYGRDGAWVLRGADLSLVAGEVRAIVGGNGSGKSTLLMAVAGMLAPRRGRIANALAGSQALLPQQPKALLSRPSVEEELMEWAPTAGYDRERMLVVAASFGLEGALARHPYDLSGGQQQLLALAKLLLARPRLLLLDEPTKGLDHAARSLVAAHVRRAAAGGATVLLSTHDVAFARAVADSCSLLFDGQVALTQPAGQFFRESWVWRA
ncbi:ATP-binding cassette domain-containing protein [Parafannyhessea umbonata]|uniref:ATP-binding cassette domain-containing protein n=1 Tax=Parafannyhessea umbonata TaxID=604330 RepID=UPI0026EB7570|nr:ABC transporter ATP-binding protein [Parafannyhessea umbonata]MCI6681020.1 ATP-binding cassette domain-containing protein [Parafannyhessea umbonata]MCI7218669.1 ATP-binding cassette domain-containing protein [Parafannyhessea umbonata]MDY4014594.1 ATP-binding cassette domain-containing protein [Parafannyhessea umbonata]